MKIIFLLARIYWKIFRPLTWGVRLMLIKNDEIVLVRHTYRDGWFLPGGGLKRRETFTAAARREAHEEDAFRSRTSLLGYAPGRCLRRDLSAL